MTPPFYLLLLAVSIGCVGCGGGGGAAASGAAPRIAFVSDRDGTQAIYTMNADGSEPRRLTHTPMIDNSPCWSPDHRHLAFVSYRDGNAQIYVMKADGSGLLRLTQDAGPNGGPAWSPDGSRIAYVAGGQQIWVMHVDGSAKVQLTSSQGINGGPAWSPDGTRIYFVSNRDSGGTPFLLYVMNADGTDQHAIGNHLEVDGRPAASPDGRHLAYASDLTPTEPDLFVANADGSVPTRLGPDGSAEPAWAPNGRVLTFTSWRDGNAQLYSIRVDGTHLRRLTHDAADDGGAAW